MLTPVTITNAPETLHILIGSDTQRGGVMQIGYKPAAAFTEGNASGSFVAQEGSFNAYVTELRVGENLNTSGSATGVLDLRDTDLGVLDIAGIAVIGGGEDGVGEVRLKGGTASSTSLTIGSSTADGRSLLSLNGTEWTVTDSFLLGDKGDFLITLGTDGSGGLTLLDDTEGSFLIEDEGILTVSFTAEASGMWGLKVAGDRTGLLQDYLRDGMLVAAGDYGGLASVHYDGNYTYFGYQAIPEPSTYALLGSMALGAFAYRMRKKR